MANVYNCTHCQATVTADDKPSTQGCIRREDYHSSHDWVKIGTHNTSGSGSASSSSAGEELLQTVLRMMLDGITNSNLSVPTRLLIASPILAIPIFFLYVTFGSTNTDKAPTEPERYSSFGSNVRDDSTSAVSNNTPKEEPRRDFQAEANADLKVVNPSSVDAGEIDIATFTDRHPATLVSDGRLNQRFRSLMGNDFEEFLDYLAVASDVTVDGNHEIFGDGMAPHSGGEQAASYVINQSGRLYAVLIDKSKNPSIRIYGAPNFDGLPLNLRNLVAENRS